MQIQCMMTRSMEEADMTAGYAKNVNVPLKFFNPAGRSDPAGGGKAARGPDGRASCRRYCDYSMPPSASVAYGNSLVHLSKGGGESCRTAGPHTTTHMRGN
jgi:hypothetical protein